MKKMNAIAYKDRQAKNILTEKKRIQISKDTIVLVLMSFLLGRASILEGLAPFGMAFFITLLMKDRKNGYLGFFVLLGTFFSDVGVNVEKYSIALALSFVIFSYGYVRDKIGFKTFRIAASASVVTFTAGLVYMMATDFYMYDLFMEAFEAVVVFVFIYILSYSIPVIIHKNHRRILANEELICIAISIAIVISGLSNVEVLECSIKNIFGILLTLIFAYNGGASVGASVGITIGIITSMSNIGTPTVIGIYGFSGLLAGIFKDLGKFGSAIGMVLGNAILTFYINGSTEVIIQFEEIIVASAMFMCMPKGIMNYMEKFINHSDFESDKTYGQRIKRMVNQQLREYSTAFSELAVTYENIAQTSDVIEQSDVASMVNEVTNKVCHNCGMCRSCWQNNFSGMYSGVVDVITYLETEGMIKSNQIPEVLKKRCIKMDALINIIHDRFEVYKVNHGWKKKIFENRKLVAEQLKGVSDIIGDLSNRINRKVNFRIEVEEALYIAFDKEGILVNKVVASETDDGKFEIEIEKRPCFDRRQCDERIASIVSAVLGRKVTRKGDTCTANFESGSCSFTFVEAEKYKVATGVAKASKDKSGICGDSYSYMNIPENSYMMALSDGMGSGKRAAKESQATIALLEHLMEAGFEEELAIKTINSVLVLKSSEETFSTMDLSIMDLHTGKIEFVKIGSAASFIKRKNGDVEMIKSTSLPIGIFNDVDIENFGKKLNSGDFVIMMTDGIIDAEQELEEKEKWVEDVLKNITARNPQLVAEELLEKAIEKYGNKVEDDMSVMVSKIWEVK